MPLVVAGALVLTSTAVTGFEPDPTSRPDAAFHRVTVPTHAPSAPASPRALDDEVLMDPAFATPPPGRAQPSFAPARPVVVPVPTVAPKPDGSGGSGSSGGSTSGAATTHSLRGYASWYCRAGVSICTIDHPDTGGFNAYAAAGPKLRAALGDWRGRIVSVDGIRVKLIDWCQCYKGESNEKLLDLYYDVFARTGSPVTIRW